MHAGLMGQVRYVQSGAIAQQLQAGNIVLLTNVGVSAAGELLNCNIYDVSREQRKPGWDGWRGCRAGCCHVPVKF